jgi:hypothetical protein
VVGVERGFDLLEWLVEFLTRTVFESETASLADDGSVESTGNRFTIRVWHLLMTGIGVLGVAWFRFRN